MTTNEDSLRSRIALLYRILPLARRRQVMATIAIMMVSAPAEILSIGSLIPFLSALIDPASLPGMPFAGPLLKKLAGGGSLVATAAAIFVVLLLISGVLRLWLIWARQRLAFDVGYDLSVIAFGKLLRQPYDYYARTNSSERIGSFEKIGAISFSVLMGGIQAVVSTFMAVLLLFFMSYLSPTIALGAGSVLVLAYGLVSLFVRRRLKRNSTMIAVSWSARVEAVQVALGGIRDIVFDHSQRVFDQQFALHADRLRHAQSANAFISGSPKIVIETLGLILVALIAWLLVSNSGGLLAAIPLLGPSVIGTAASAIAPDFLPRMEQCSRQCSTAARGGRHRQPTCP